MERRKAMRFRRFTVSQAVPEAKQDKVRLAALHAPHIEGANEAGLARLRGQTKSSPRAMRENECAWLFEN
jgi:hypothetical protein